MRFLSERELPRSRTCTGGRQEPYLRLLSFALLFNPVFCGCGRIRVYRGELKGGGGVDASDVFSENFQAFLELLSI